MLTKGVGFIMIAVIAFSAMNVMAKYLSTMHPMQVVFFRAAGSLIFIFPYMIYHNVNRVGNHPKLLLLRAVLGLISLATFFWAIQRIPLGSAISIRYLGPIFGAILAVYYLREKVNIKQWISFAIAFAGVLVLKGFDYRIDLFSFSLVMISAILVGMVFVLIRYLGSREHYLTIINYFMMTATISGLFFISYFRIPIGIEWWSVAGIGIFGLIGQLFMTRAFQLEEASILAPFKYLELIFSGLIGYFIFSESYEVVALLGMILIVGGMVMNVYFKEGRKGLKVEKV